MDTITVLEIIKILNNQQDDTNALLEGRREAELGDSWIFRNDYVRYGVNKALDMLHYHLQSLIEGELNAEENKTVE